MGMTGCLKRAAAWIVGSRPAAGTTRAPVPMVAWSRPAAGTTVLLGALVVFDAAAFEATQQREGVTLAYSDPADALAAPMRTRIIDTFFAAYVRERADFHPGAPSQVRIVIDPGYDGIAFVGEGKGAATITINPAWLAKRPDDVDLVTHEAMHIVQGYPEYANERVPGWLVEGIADYARDRYGRENAAADDGEGRAELRHGLQGDRCVSGMERGAASGAGQGAGRRIARWALHAGIVEDAHRHGVAGAVGGVRQGALRRVSHRPG